MKENPKSFFMNHLWQMEIILFVLFSIGVVLRILKIGDATYIFVPVLSVFAFAYFIMSILIGQVKNMNRNEKLISIFSYLFISVLSVCILLILLSTIGPNYIHIGMVLVLVMILLVQIRKIKYGVISSSLTFIMFRLIIFWLIGLGVFFLYYFSV